MPSIDLLPAIESPFELQNTWVWNGMNYAKTCRQWLRRLDANRPQLLHILAENYGSELAVIWYQRWRMFFIACEELFAFHRGHEWFVTHYLFQSRS